MSDTPELFSPEFNLNPYPTYHRLRQETPLFQVEGTNVWIATRYEDCALILRDKRFGHRTEERQLIELGRDRMNEPSHASLRRMMLLADPPDHTRLRGLVVKAFDRRGVERLRTGIRALAHQLVDRLEPLGGGDLVDLFTHPLPVMVICQMLGIPEEDWDRFLTGRILGRIIDPTPMSDEEMAQSNQNTLEAQAYFCGLFDERRARPKDDLLTALVESETEHGVLTPEELSANVALLFGAGHETTVNLMGNALIALYRNRDQLDLLRNDPSLFPSAVEEFLRYDSSVQLTARTALEDVPLGGTVIGENDRVLCLLGAANRDPAMFDDPDRLDVRRPNVRPMSFGGGIHFCLGAQLARIEGAEALAILFDRLPNLELTDPEHPDWKETITLRGVKTLMATW